jgi:hypothetical protein
MCGVVTLRYCDRNSYTTVAATVEAAAAAYAPFGLRAMSLVRVSSSKLETSETKWLSSVFVFACTSQNIGMYTVAQHRIAMKRCSAQCAVA